MATSRSDGQQSRSPHRIAEPTQFGAEVVEVVQDEDSGDDVLACALRGRVSESAESPIPLVDWQKKLVEEWKKERSTFTDLGAKVLYSLGFLDTPLGDFVRRYSHHMQPPPAAEAHYARKGDLLPIHPTCVKAGECGVSLQSQEWVKLMFTLINFNYCTGWTKPICVPMDTQLSPNQKLAIAEVAKAVEDNILCADLVPTYGEAKASLQSKKFDYSGNPVEYMQDLVADRVFPTWPRPGEAAIRCITDFLEGEVKEAMADPNQWILPLDLQPASSKKSIVRATEEEWYKICAEGYKRGLFCMVDDAEVPRDRAGHLVVNGAGGVTKLKEVNGQQVQLQRFISVLIPTNEMMMDLPGAQDTLPYVGQLTALYLAPDEELYLDSEDLQSAFNLFRVPRAWSPFFAYARKVDGRAFGRPDLGKVRPALCVVPMGWKSAVTLVQFAVRHIVFNLAKVPRATSLEKGLPIPEGDRLTVVYLDNFDQVRIMKAFGDGLAGSEDQMTESHKKFNEVCDELGLPRNAGKQLIGAACGGIQGGEFNGIAGTIKVGREKLQNFVAISLALITSPVVTEFQVRHWIGKAAFIATFRRPLFAILQEVFGLLEKCKTRGQALSPAVMDEILCFVGLATQSQSELRADLSPVISCTDASPSGGGSAIAVKFKNKSLVVPEELPARDVCGCCGTGFETRDPQRRVYQCPRKCGERFCSAICAADHTESGCNRADFFAPKFGERFSGPRYPLTKACGLAGIAIQKPLDKLVSGDEWDILTEQGKKRLAEAEADPALKAEHWAPECRTFSRARGRWIQLPDTTWIQGPRQVRSSEEPWGFEELSRGDAIAVRQGNTYMKRSLKGLTQRHKAGGVASLEHPYNSFIWDTEEIERLRLSGDWYLSVYSHCCFGGERVKWTHLLHNSPYLHRALHKPDCPGHENLRQYRVHWSPDGQLSFDTSLEAEYPWGFCVTYAHALAAHLRAITPAPVGEYPYTLESLVYTQVRGATRGLQDEAHVNRVVAAVCHTLQEMTEGNEGTHLQWLLRNVGLRGTDVRITVPDEQIQKEVVHPYPAFRWLWRTVLSYPWSSEQHINLLEVTAVLTEFRRRLRDPTNIKLRFMNIVDSLVTYYAITKGRSGSKRLNRTLRRLMALNIASKSVLISLWTLSKWNYADAASRRFEK